MVIEGILSTRKKLADGSWRYYYYTSRHKGRLFWKQDGKPLDITKPLPANVVAAYQAARAEAPSYAGDLDMFIANYLASTDYKKLSRARQTELSRCLGAVPANLRKASVGAIEHRRFRKLIRTWRDTMKDSPRHADIHVGALSVALQYAMDDGELSVNPALGVKNLYTRPDDKRPIPQQDIEKFLETAPQHVADAFCVALFSGYRRTDVARVGWSAYKGSHLDRNTSKSRGRTLARTPLPPVAQAFFDDLKARQIASDTGLQLTIVTGANGRPMKPESVGRMINDHFATLKMGHTLHRLRNTYATLLAKAGFKAEEIASVMGWSVKDAEDMIRIYVDQEQVMSAAIARIEKGTRD